MQILNDENIVIAENVKTSDDWKKIEQMVEELAILIKDRYNKNLNQLQSARLNAKK